MATQTSVHTTLSCLRNVRPPVTTHSRSKWADTFTDFSSDDRVQEKYAEEIESLKKEVRRMLVDAKSRELMILIDTIERLGLAYHFEAEIEEKLQEIYKEDGDSDLFTTALQFRLLRQHHYHVSCSIFNKFKDNNDKFLEILTSDIEGLLSLYEAAYIQMNGEDILKEAVTFTTHHLTCVVPNLESPLKDKVKRALGTPYHRDVPIIHARIFISTYEKDDFRNEALLKLAKLNFNCLQNLYKKELCDLSRWWYKFDLKSKLPYARDNLIAAYLWAIAFYFEPQYSDGRMVFTKITQIIAIMDDTYDNYATLTEAKCFTEDLERWSMDEIDRLPDYMKIVYHFIEKTFEDIERDATKNNKSFAAPYIQETVKQLGRAYNQELEWFMERKMPSFEEYVKNSEITSCIYIMFVALFPSMKSATKETFNWLLGNPQLAISTAMIGRFCNDLGSHKRESKGGKMLTVVDCYMKQHGVTKEETLSKFVDLIEDAWRNLNTALATTNSIPKDITVQFLNFARITDATYKDNEDAYTNPKFLEPIINALFVDPIFI